MQPYTRAGLAGLTCLALLATARLAAGFALAPRPAPVPQRVALADVIVVGQVTSIEDRVAKAERYPGDPMPGEFRVAVVKVEQALKGAAGLTHIKVGFQQAPAGPVGVPPRDRVRPVPPRLRPQPVVLTKGQEACLFLKPHHKETFHVIATAADVIDRKSKEVEETAKAARLLADPMAGLKAREAPDRYLTAVMLLSRYRSQTAPKGKWVPVDPAESKLILAALAGADFDRPRTGYDPLHPQNLFNLLGAQPKDGWKQPADFRQVGPAMKKWLADHADTFRVQKWQAE